MTNPLKYCLGLAKVCVIQVVSRCWLDSVRLSPHRLHCLVGSIALWSLLRALVGNRNQEMIPSVNANPISLTSDSHIYRTGQATEHLIACETDQPPHQSLVTSHLGKVSK